jgi:virginiamycin B lyase
LAPDGAVWFAEGSAYSITRYKDGQFQRNVIGSVRGGPYGVAVARDGTVWATLQAGNQLVRIGGDGTMRSFDIPTRGSSPSDIAVDAKGVVWFLEFRGNKLGRFEDGKFQEFVLGEANVGPTGLAVAPDGAVWLGMLRVGSLGRFADGKLERIALPRKNARPYGVAVDASGNVWYTDTSGYVGMLQR